MNKPSIDDIGHVTLLVAAFGMMAVILMPLVQPIV